MKCIWCDGPREFVNGGESAGFKCVDSSCPGWADQTGDFVGSDGIRRIAPLSRQRCATCGLMLSVDHPDIHADGRVECPPGFDGTANSGEPVGGRRG